MKTRRHWRRSRTGGIAILHHQMGFLPRRRRPSGSLLRLPFPLCWRQVTVVAQPQPTVVRTVRHQIASRFGSCRMNGSTVSISSTTRRMARLPDQRGQRCALLPARLQTGRGKPPGVDPAAPAGHRPRPNRRRQPRGNPSGRPPSASAIVSHAPVLSVQDMERVPASRIEGQEVAEGGVSRQRTHGVFLIWPTGRSAKTGSTAPSIAFPRHSWAFPELPALSTSWST